MLWLNIEAIPKSGIKFVIKSDIKFDISIKPTTCIGQMKRNLKEENWTKLNFLSKAQKKVSKYQPIRPYEKKPINNRDKPFKALFQEKYDTKRHFNQNFLY